MSNASIFSWLYGLRERGHSDFLSQLSGEQRRGRDLGFDGLLRVDILRVCSNSSNEITLPARISLRAVSIILRNSGLTLSERAFRLRFRFVTWVSLVISSRAAELGLPDLAELWVAAGELLA